MHNHDLSEAMCQQYLGHALSLWIGGRTGAIFNLKQPMNSNLRNSCCCHNGAQLQLFLLTSIPSRLHQMDNKGLNNNITFQTSTDMLCQLLCGDFVISLTRWTMSATSEKSQQMAQPHNKPILIFFLLNNRDPPDTIFFNTIILLIVQLICQD